MQIRAVENKVTKFAFIKVAETRTQSCQKCYSMWIVNSKNTVCTGHFLNTYYEET